MLLQKWITIRIVERCFKISIRWNIYCLLYTSDAADEEDSVDLGGRRIIKKKNIKKKKKREKNITKKKKEEHSNEQE